MSNIYDTMPLSHLIKTVQRAHLNFESEKKKGLVLKNFSKKASELAQLKYTLIQRLNVLDRNTTEFFPPGSIVKYIHPLYSQKEKIGEVVMIRDEMCLCQFHGDNYQVKVDPKNLKLMYIRS